MNEALNEPEMTAALNERRHQSETHSQLPHMLLPVSLSVLSFQGSRDIAIDSLVKDVGKSEPSPKDVGKSEPSPGSARRQLLASGVTFNIFNANTGSSKWSVWLGRDAPDTQLTNYTEISPAGGLSYGSGGTATNQATYENSNWVVKPPGAEPSGDKCDAGAVFPDTTGSGIQSWATSQDHDHFGTVIFDSGQSDSGCTSLAEVSISNKLSAATSCAGLMLYAAEIDPAFEKGVKTYARKVGDTGVAAVSAYMLGSEGNSFSYAITHDQPDCGSSYSYEFITLNEEDATRLESNPSQGWDAAVPKSIHPKISKASTNRAYLPTHIFRLRPPPPQPSLAHRSHPVAFLLPRTQSMEPNTSPLFVLHGKYNDPAKPITLSCQGCMPGSTDSDSAAATSRGQLGMAVILTLTARLWLSL